MTKISRIRLAEVIARKHQTTNAKELSQEIAAYLLSEGRVGELDSLMRDVMQYRSDNGTVEVVATEAYELSDAVRADIKQLVVNLYPEAKEIIISEVIDSNAIGGVRLEFANSQLDLSVRTKLNRFKQLTAATGGI